MPRSFSLATLLALQTVGCLCCGFLATIIGTISSVFLFWFIAIAGVFSSIVVAALRRTHLTKRFEIAVACSLGYFLLAAYLAVVSFALRWGIGRVATRDDLEGILAVVASVLFAVPVGVIGLVLMREATWTYWDHHDSQQN